MAEYTLPPSGWIWMNDSLRDRSEVQCVYFRRVLQLAEVPQQMPVRVSADSRYRLYVNGHSVAFGPCKGDGQVWYYETVDIAPYLRQGENVVAAMVVHFSLLALGNHSVWRTRTPGLYVQGEQLVADGAWRCRPAERVAFVPEGEGNTYLCVNERADGDVALQGWLRHGYDDSGWQQAVPYGFFELKKSGVPGNLRPRPIPPMYETPRRFTGVQCVRETTLPPDVWTALPKGTPVTLPPHTRQVVELDAGELTTGFLTLCLAGGAGANIEILCAESYVYEPDTDISHPSPRKGDRTDSVNGHLHGYTDTYAVGGFGEKAQPEVYEPFWFRTFRFVRLVVETGAQPLVLHSLAYRETGYPLEAKTVVETSDESLVPVWDISLRSLRRCMHETYEDCPFYEQLQYAMDARTQILYTYAVAADDRMARRTIDDYHRSLRADGLINACYPSVNTNVIPGFSLYYIMMLHDHMLYFGDRTLVNRYLPTVQAILGFFERNVDSRGLVGQIGGIIGLHAHWSFIDWTPEWNRTAGVPDAIRQGPLTMESLLYCMALDMAAELAGYVGQTQLAGHYRESAEAVRQAVHTHCLGAGGLYQDGPGVERYSQHCQVFAVLTETAPEAQWQPLMRRALAEEGLAGCSVAMAFYLFRALEKAGLYEQTQPLWAPWHKMVRNNLTTCEEDQVHDSARSDCHAWGALALYELPSALLGVRPTKPGYAAAVVRPAHSHLHWAKGSVATPHGIIQVEWTRENGETRLEVQAPPVVEIEK